MQSTASRPLRLAFIDSWLQSAVAGSGTAVGINGLEAALQQIGHAVDRIAPPTSGWWGRLPITARRLLFNLTLRPTLDPSRYDALVGFDFDGVFLRSKVTGERSKASGSNLRPSTRAFQPFVCSIKGVIAEEARHETGRVRLLFQLLARLEGANTRRADCVLVESDYCRRAIMQHYGVRSDRIAIVPEGIDVQGWSAALATAPSRQADQPTILCVARHYRRKHIDDLIRAFAIVRRYVPDARLRLVGSGPEFDRNMELARSLGIMSSVTFLGGVADADVKREYVACDVFCLPSVQEGFGIVLLEAMVAGKPIVATTATAIPEVVQHGETGILVPPRDVQSLAGALLLLLTDADRRAAYGRTARQRVERYDWRRVADQFVAAIAPAL